MLQFGVLRILQARYFKNSGIDVLSLDGSAHVKILRIILIATMFQLL